MKLQPPYFQCHFLLRLIRSRFLSNTPFLLVYCLLKSFARPSGRLSRTACFIMQTSTQPTALRVQLQSFLSTDLSNLFTPCRLRTCLSSWLLTLAFLKEVSSLIQRSVKQEAGSARSSLNLFSTRLTISLKELGFEVPSDIHILV